MGERAKPPGHYTAQLDGHKLSLSVGVEAIKTDGGVGTILASPLEEKSGCATTRAIHRAIREDPEAPKMGRVPSLANLAHCSFPVEERDRRCAWWSGKVLNPKHPSLHML